MMLTQDHLERYANVMLWGLFEARKELRGVFAPGEMIRIVYDLEALPLLEIIYKKCIQSGFHVVTECARSPRMEKDFYENASDAQIDFLAPWIAPQDGKERFGNTIAESINGSLYLMAPTSFDHLAGVDPGKIGKAQLSRKPYIDCIDKREAKGAFAWSLCLYPTPQAAVQAQTTYEKYCRQIISACYLDDPDPVQKWKDFLIFSNRVKQWLVDLQIDTIHVNSEKTDLHLKIGKRRKWLGVSGHNIPSFEIFTCPDFRYTEGTYYFDQPSLKNGNIVQGGTLEFKNGKVVKATAQKGEKYLQAQLAMDEGASFLGEFSLTDGRYSRITQYMANTLYDENVGGPNGNCHVAVGRSFFASAHDGDLNLSIEQQKELGYNDSALHWDLVTCEPRTVTAKCRTGQTVEIYKDGKFTL
jgi:aminopeptidase